MRTFLISVSAIALLVGVAQADGPVFPAPKGRAAASTDVKAPDGAQHRVRSGRSGVTFVACNEFRTYAAGAKEFHCLTWSAKKEEWSKTEHWYPEYQLMALEGPLPAEPTVTAIPAP